MLWLIGIVVLIFLILCIFLVSVLVIEVDTRVPQAGIRWGFLGKAIIWYDDEWWLSMQLLFFRKTIRVASIKMKSAKKETVIEKQAPKKRKKIKRLLKRILRIIQTFKVIEWTLFIDTGDNVYNAQLYPLIFLSKTYKHIFINFRNENFLLLKIRNYPWKILYTFFK